MQGLVIYPILNYHMINNVILAAIDEHMEEAELTLNEAQEECNQKS